MIYPVHENSRKYYLKIKATFLLLGGGFFMTKIMTNFMTFKKKKTKIDDRLIFTKTVKIFDLWAF